MKTKAKALLTKWGLLKCAVSKHVLEDCSVEELDFLAKSGYAPDHYNKMRSPSELIGRHAAELRERKFVVGGSLDNISCFH